MGTSPLISTVKKWAAEFKRGGTSLEDDPCERRLKISTTPEIFEQICEPSSKGDVLSPKKQKEVLFTLIFNFAAVCYNPFVTSETYTSHLQRVFSSPLG
jgi:hypothetical protein